MDGKMGRAAAEGIGEAYLRSTNMEASERPSRSSPVRDVIWASSGFKGTYWHTLEFEEQTEVDVRTVCPQDAKKVLLKQAREAYWKRWAAKHEHEELKEGVWLEPIEALIRK